jgi:hypothetical protein
MTRGFFLNLCFNYIYSNYIIMDTLIETNYFITQAEVNKFLWATLLCGIIGAEREFKNKQAGLKTMIYYSFY